MGRAPCCDKVGLKRGRWTAEEDERLTNYILHNGQGSWRSLPKNAGLLRCGKSCRLRWINYLRADLKRGDITPLEEDTIIKLHATLGNRWSTIAGQLPGRTDNEIKNYWNSHLSRRIHTIRRPNGEKNIINLSNVSAPPKRRGGRTSRAAMQRNKNNNVIGIKNVNSILSENNLRNINNSSNNNNNLPQFGSTLENNLIEDENLLLGIEDIMGLDGLLSTSDMSLIGPNNSIGLYEMGPIGEEQEQSSGLAHSTRSNGGGSTPSSSSTLSCFDQFDGGLGWDMDIDMIDDVSAKFDQLCDEKEQIISWLWENDDNYLEESVFSNVVADVDSDKEQAMLTWLMS